MNRFRVLFAFVLGVSLSLAAIPGADGAAVPGERILYVEIPGLRPPYRGVVMDPDGSNEFELVDNSAGDPSPDGKWVLHFPHLGHSMWMVPSDGGAPVKVIDAPDGTLIGSPNWSPDSQRLVFALRTPSAEDEHDPTFTDVWMVNIDGSELVNLTNTPIAEESDPVWFPDGSRVLFEYSPTPWETGGLRELGVIDVAAGGSYDVITNEPDLLFSMYPAVGFVNDGHQLIVAALPVLDPDPENPQYGPSDLWRVDADTGAASVLLGANADSVLRVMDVSTDGSMFLYRASASGASTIWLADANGGNRTKVYKKAGMGVWDAQFNTDATLVLLNPHYEDTDYIVVKDLDTGDATTLRSGEGLYTRSWIPPGALCDGVVATITGTDGDDTLIGTSGDDVIVGYGGDDVIEGRGGDDVICAGYGNDAVRGEAGHDVILGGPGQDELRGGAGKDMVRGESGNDTLYGGKGKDVIRGGDGADWIHGQWRPDRLYGNLGQDVIYGGDDTDSIDGGKANDHLYGGDGDDTVAGNKGDDHLSGGPGDDSLDGGPDIDVVNGNAGTDTCTGETTLNC